MIHTHNLAKAFGPRHALYDINLHIAPGEYVTLAGPNGAGKTTLLRILATLALPSSGTLRLAGSDPQRAGAPLRGQIGFLSHRPFLYGELTAQQNLAFYAQLYGIPNAAETIRASLAAVALGNRRDDTVRTLSRGLQQRLALARATLHRPKLLLLDEPYAGLDTFAAERLSAQLEQLHAAGCTLLLASHTLSPARITGRRTLVISRGRIVHDDTVRDAQVFLATYRQLSTTPPQKSTSTAPTPPQKAATAIPANTRVHPLRQTLAIVAKDITAELHTKEAFSAMAVFAVLTLLIFSFTLDLHGAAAQTAAPGILWTSIAFAGTLGLSRSLAREHTNGALEGLLLAPLPRTAIFFGKALGNILLMLAVELILLPLTTVLFNVPLLRVDILALCLLGTLGYASAGTLLASIAGNTRAREVLLPILLLPLVIPLLIAVTQACGNLLAGASWREIGGWTRLLVAYDMISIAVAMLTFEFVVEA